MSPWPDLAICPAVCGRERRPVDTVPFRKGDAGTEMHLIVEGRVEPVEIGKRLGPGQVLGGLRALSV